MSKEKISSQEIIDQVSIRAKVSKRASEEFLKVMIATVEDALVSGESVKIKGFGTFKLQWNEPRKSVNVKTGEEIILEGYHKVSFTPDNVLKDIVNEPFAHLEPVLLDAGNNFVIPEEPAAEEFDPLKVFTEQASEIKDLLSEIRALSGKPNAEKVDELLAESNNKEDESSWPSEYIIIDEDDEDVAEESDDDLESADNNVDVMDHIVAEELEEKSFSEGDVLAKEQLLVVVEPDESPEYESVEVLPIEDEPHSNAEDLEIVVDNVNSFWNEPAEQGSEKADNLDTSLSDNLSSESVSNNMSDSISGVQEADSLLSVKISDDPEEEKPDLDLYGSPFMVDARRKKTKRAWTFGVFLGLLGIIVIGAVLYFAVPSVKRLLNDGMHSIGLNGNDEPKTVVVAPKRNKTVTKRNIRNNKVDKAQSVVNDTLKLLNEVRNYDTFIGSEQIVKGTRLEVLALKYYGNTVFWVYIFEANKERIDSPDLLIEGTLIRIPKLDDRLVDLRNPRCLSYARTLSEKYLKK